MSELKPVPQQTSFPKLEEEILKLWRDQDTFKRSIEQRPKEREFVFYDGPPFATGLPHYGHLVASTIKDIVPRYWAMRGHRVERRFGWDTHGLPIEMEIEKKLGLSGPTSILEYGVDRFNEACRENVLRYTEEWEEVINRLGRWVDFKNDYKTMDLNFMESVWWVFKALWEKGLVYQGFRVMPFSWRLSTALSNFEANLDYRDVQDPAVTVRMPLVDEDASLLIWTTTPWTLPSNLAVAVGVDIEYVKARKTEGDDQQAYYVAADLLTKVLGEDVEILSRVRGADLVGKQYVPIFDYFADRALLPQGEGKCFIVIAGDHVTTSDGTGIVHMAPDFGEEDFNACRELGIELVQSVDNEGRFKDNIIGLQGKNIKEADGEIIAFLKQIGRLYKRSTIQHSYPYCWRSGTPLIYKAVPSWFIKVESIRDRMSAHNDEIHWVPNMVGSNRFGNWLKDARDWNVSRNRFWGTPLPIWTCEGCETITCLGSVEELEAKAGAEVNDIHPHKIDHLTWSCELCGAQVSRVSEVFDCWFESGAMPYAQNHYPFERREEFEAAFPAQFIAEGLDQTRGWFYTLLVLSTALFDRPPFKNVIVNGMVLAEDGSKMSKSKRNYPPPNNVLDVHGADALRAYLINSPIVRAEPLRFSEEGVKDVARVVLIPMRNAWSFFTMYALVDGWHPRALTEGAWSPEWSDEPIPTPELEARADLDRWMISTLQSLIAEVNEHMEGYYLYKVIPPIVAFIDDLTNWYIRRSRRRFWRSAESVEAAYDKASAYATLYEVLVEFSKVMAPVLPFLSESIYQHLVVDLGVAEERRDSVHLCDYPEASADKIDAELEREFTLTRQVVRMGRALRATHNLKTRQPLTTLTVVHPDRDVLSALKEQDALIREELNIKAIKLVSDDQDLATFSFKANFKTLGRRLGKRMKAASQVIQGFTRAEWSALEAGQLIEVEGEPITTADVIMTPHAREGVVLEFEDALTVALDTELNADLVREGLAREVISRCQKLRKSSGLEISDRVRLTVCVDDAELTEALKEFHDEICAELLALELTLQPWDTGAELVSSLGAGAEDMSDLSCVAGLVKA